jgi:predicted RNA binding protein YcfA (HicA-like mRNA interferase family)
MRLKCVIIILGGDGLTVKNAEKLIKSDGWYLSRIKGSHKQYSHPTKKGIVTIPDHSGDIPKGTFNSILKQAGLK